MFGYIAADWRAFSKEERARYEACYCGLCHALDEQFGSIGCASLTYDMTFLSILLGSLYNLLERNGERRCAHHPFKPRPYVESAATAYAADMNVLLAYYQSLDDWHDDRNQVARKKSEMLQPFLDEVRHRNPRQFGVVEGALAELGKMERANELNPDLPANCFGGLMAELFIWHQDGHEQTLREMGAALGRFIYLLDAVNDLRADIKKQRYNPLVAQMDTDFTPILTLMMAECTEAFARLPLERDLHILQNVLYAGVWQRYHLRKGREKT